eukprot:CAMPEP_0206419906 /NCGR_PEP_ID=MMETSP0324_2-20121206/475_1 /ASSEMBLY_ACC=CAM_ASM_000836 /TAXON_ID=2866 /ORGANISM="Crypthecodinium cohnii, Strain Seligo" /LENGTH=110 /DNA_ID=CAMNT_0053883587 /DNA_START=292 /DNA_END=624 /DNA_ORIENTATION=+
MNAVPSKENAFVACSWPKSSQQTKHMTPARPPNDKPKRVAAPNKGTTDLQRGIASIEHPLIKTVNPKTRRYLPPKQSPKLENKIRPTPLAMPKAETIVPTMEEDMPCSST